MKTRLLKRLRRKAKRNIEICVPIMFPEHGYYFFNKYLLRTYSPREKYDKYPWTKNAFTKYCKTVDEVREVYKYVLWSETFRLFSSYKAREERKKREKELRKSLREIGL